MPTPFDQGRYQVRLEWGVSGLARLAPADIVVVVDVLRFSSTVAAALAVGDSYPLDEAAHAISLNGAAVVRAAATAPTTASGANPTPARVVVLGCLRNAPAIARFAMEEQARRGGRTSIAIIAAGERTDAESTAPRFAVEDLLGAGAIIDALGGVGIDHTSPEAAAAAEAFRGLRGAVRHLLTASGSGQELIERDARDDVLAAAAIGDLDVVPVLDSAGVRFEASRA